MHLQPMLEPTLHFGSAARTTLYLALYVTAMVHKLEQLLCIMQKQGRFEVYEGDGQPPMSPPVGTNAQALMEQHLGSKPVTPEHAG